MDPKKQPGLPEEFCQPCGSSLPESWKEPDAPANRLIQCSGTWTED